MAIYGCARPLAYVIHKLSVRMESRFAIPVQRILSRRSVRFLIPTLLLLIVSFVAAGVLYCVERVFPIARGGLNWSEDAYRFCLTDYDYMATLSFVNSLSTTIGFGNIYPCTVWGRIASAIYIIISIPINVVVLDKLGRIFVLFLRGGWQKAIKLRQFTRICRKDRVYPVPKIETDDQTIPFTLGVITAIIWCLITSVYFYLTEQWAFHDAVYFTIVALTTVGLGDFSPLKYNFTVLTYFFLYVGLAVISTNIQILRDNIDNLISNVENEIMEEYKRRVMEGPERLANGDATHKDAEAPKKQTLIRQQELEAFLVKKYGRLATMVPKAQLKHLYTLQENVTNKTNVKVQAVETMTDSEAQATAATQEQGTDCDVVTQDEGTQTDLLPAATTAPMLPIVPKVVLKSKLSQTIVRKFKHKECQAYTGAVLAYGRGAYIKPKRVSIPLVVPKLDQIISPLPVPEDVTPVDLPEWKY